MHITLLREKTVLGSRQQVVIADTNIRSVRSARRSRTTTAKLVGMSDGSAIYTFLLPRQPRPHGVVKGALPHLSKDARVAALDRPIYRSLVKMNGASKLHPSEDELHDVPGWRELDIFWVRLKGRLSNTYMHFREERLMRYIKEFEWRDANCRKPDGGFGDLISEFPEMPSGTRPVISLTSV